MILRVGDYVTGAFRHSFRELGIMLENEEINAIRGRSKRDAIVALFQQHMGAQAENMAESVHQTFQKVLRKAVSQQGVEPMPGAEEVFKWLKDQNVRVALSTGFDRHVTSLMLDSVSWTAIVDAVVCGDEVNRGRPAAGSDLESDGADRPHRGVSRCGGG